MQINIKSLQDITYENLIKLSEYTSYTDHLNHFRTLFHAHKVGTFLEWGCGFSSKIFLDDCDRVISVELMTGGGESEWMNFCKRLFGGHGKWTPIAEVVCSEIQTACVQFSTPHPNLAKVHPQYIRKLNESFDRAVSGEKVDVCFVDSLVYIRGDLVELALQRGIPVVAAHDTACCYQNYPDTSVIRRDHGHYGWFRIQDHPEYERLFIDYGQGTTFWVHRSLPELAQTFRKYIDTGLAAKHHLNLRDLVEGRDYHLKDGKYRLADHVA